MKRENLRIVDFNGRTLLPNFYFTEISMSKVNGRGKAKVLSQHELQEILETAENRFGFKYKLLFAIAYYTGCRMSEALALQWKDISSTYINFNCTKTSSYRSVPIHPALRTLLDQHKRGGGYGYLFASGKGHLSFKTADKNLRWICDYCGFTGISTHSFRRTAMTNLYRAGVQLTVIQDFTGHKDFNELREYLEHDDDAVEKAILVL